MIRPAPVAGRSLPSRCRAPLLPRFLALGARLPRLVRRRSQLMGRSAAPAQPRPARDGRAGRTELTVSRSPAPRALTCPARAGGGGRTTEPAPVTSTSERTTTSSTTSRSRSRCLIASNMMVMLLAPRLEFTVHGNDSSRRPAHSLLTRTASHSAELTVSLGHSSMPVARTLSDHRAGPLR